MSEPTTTYDHFEVARRPDGSLWVLGQGAMGVTYRAFDSRLQCHVALKVIRSSQFADEVARERFLREARSAAAVHHPNVAGVFYLGQAGDEVFYTMELVEGVSVEDELKRVEKMDEPAALDIAVQICRALHALHRAGLVHRDIKPANIMLLNAGDGHIVAKLVDFGLAKSVAGAAGGATLSQGSGFMGTPYYASPEQINELPVDTRSDIYSLGATLFAMLAGRPPFSGTLAVVLDRSIREPAPLEHVPEHLRGLLGKMLAKRPEERFQSPQELRAALEDALRAVPSSGRAAASPAVPAIPPAPPADPPPAQPPPAQPPPAQPPASGHPAFSLLELLKKRRSLPPSEAMPILGALAAALDRPGAPTSFPDLSTILLSGPDLSISNAGACSDLRVVFRAGADAAPGATIHSAASADPMRAPEILARIAYELLGGYHQGKDGWTPVPVLSGAGNAALRRGMQDPGAFRTAGEFLAALNPPTRKRGFARTFRTKAPSDIQATLPHPEATRPKRSFRTAAALAAVLAVAAAAGYFVFRTPPKPAPTTSQAAAPEPTPSVPEPTPEPTATPEDPSAPFLRAAAKAVEAADDAGALANYAKALDVSPAFEEPRRQMEMIAAKLRSNVVRITHAQFSKLRGPLEQAAAHNVVSAQMLLGERLRSTEPDAALKWFTAAANNGQTEAMTQTGLMMANGLGCQRDFAKAFAFFQMGASAGDSDAMVAKADCYYYGKGVPADPMLAVELLQSAAVLNHPQGMNLLGDILTKGIPGRLPPNPAEAFRLFSSAQKLGNPDAQANLGVLYVKGLGVEKDPRRAMDLWKDGAERLRSPACMLLYAVALEGGLLGERNPGAARDWYYQDAKLGNARALDWCRSNGVPVVDGN
jgi:serine/threonine protein kinase/TPR repeat protein